MKRCAICRQPAQRGSFCLDCRAALKRARDETVSQFQMRPALALAGPGGGSREPASAPRVVSREPKSRAPDKSAAVIALPRGNRAGARFIWIIVALMVLVVGYVGYGVLMAGLEAGQSRHAAPSPASEDAMVNPPVRETQLGIGVQEETRPTAALAPAVPAPVATTTPSLPVPASVAGTGPGTGDAPHGRPAAKPAAKVISAPKSVAKESSERKPVATLSNEPIAVEAPRQAVVMAAPSEPAITARPRLDRWERMEIAVRGCGGEELIGRIICEQKLRLEYCDGQWGQAAQCPGSLVNDHAQ